SLLEIAAERIAAAPKNTRKPHYPVGYEHYGTKPKGGRKSGRLSEGQPASADTASPHQSPPPPPSQPQAPTGIKAGSKRQLQAEEPTQNGKHEVSPFSWISLRCV